MAFAPPIQIRIEMQDLFKFLHIPRELNLNALRTALERAKLANHGVSSIALDGDMSGAVPTMGASATIVSLYGVLQTSDDHVKSVLRVIRQEIARIEREERELLNETFPAKDTIQVPQEGEEP